jgi:hypothetical protein
MKVQSNSRKDITKMISEKFSTNLENFTRFGRGRQIDLVNAHGYTHGDIG